MRLPKLVLDILVYAGYRLGKYDKNKIKRKPVLSPLGASKRNRWPYLFLGAGASIVQSKAAEKAKNTQREMLRRSVQAGFRRKGKEEKSIIYPYMTIQEWAAANPQFNMPRKEREAALSKLGDIVFGEKGNRI